MLSVCVETIYTEVTLKERVAALRAAGIDGFELWNLASHSFDEVHALVAQRGCRLALFCGNRRNSLVDPGQRSALLLELEDQLRAAQMLKCPALTLLSDAVDDRGIPIPLDTTVSRAGRLDSLYDSLVAAVALAEPTGVRLYLEPLNSVLDHPGYTLDQAADAFEVVQAVGHDSLKVLFDVYHARMMQVDVTRTIEGNLKWIGHVHIADVPGRHEPGTGQIDFAKIAHVLASNAYSGGIGLECLPAAKSDQAVRLFVEAFEPCMAVG